MTTVKPLKRQIIRPSTEKRKEQCSSFLSSSTTYSSSWLAPLAHLAIMLWCTVPFRRKVHYYDSLLCSLDEVRRYLSWLLLLLLTDQHSVS